MTLYSMTGHGCAEVERNGLRVNVEITSVNRKQLDVFVRLPPALTSLTPIVEELVQRHVSRGRINVDIAVRWPTGRETIEFDLPLARAATEALRRAARELRLPFDLGARDLLTVPDILRVELSRGMAELAAKVVREAVERALRELLRARAREGRALQRDLLTRLRSIERHVRAIRQHAPAVVERYRGNLRRRLAALGFDREAADDRVARELALFAERCDIHEEITRLESHIDQARRLLRGGEAAGRALDFLAQEMLREATTIAAKANDAKISHTVVALKTELERVREQGQNIE